MDAGFLEQTFYEYHPLKYYKYQNQKNQSRMNAKNKYKRLDIRCMPLFAREARAAEGGKGAYNEGNRTF